MPLSVSETSLVTNAYPVQIGNSEIVLQDELGNSDLSEVEEYSCINREVVNLENADVNINNSNDVIIGPVTQFNVNGNVTIYQNGQSQNEAINETVTQEPQIDLKSANDAKLARFEKTESEEQEYKNLGKHKKLIKIILSILFALLILVGITMIIMHFSAKLEENENYTPEPGGDSDNNLGSHQILDRSIWNGRPPISYRNITSPVPMVIMKHTGGGQCFSFQVCAGKVQSIQSSSVTAGASDIYYSFLIGGDGNIYVGRGWDVQPAQRDDTIDIAFMGSFAFDKLSPTMIEAAQLLIKDGAEKNKLIKDYKIVCHNQTRPTESPGQNVFEEVMTWPHYDSGMYYVNNVLEPEKTGKI